MLWKCEFAEKVRRSVDRFSSVWPLKAFVVVMRMKGFCKMKKICGNENSGWKRMLLAIIQDFCEVRVSILVGKMKFVLYL